MPSSHEPPNGGSGPIRPRFVRLLRLIHPLPEAPPKPKRRRRRHAVRVFTEDEQRRLRAALSVARRAMGGRAKLAEAIGCSINTLLRAERGRTNFPADIAIRLARMAHVALDAILAPGLRVVEPRP